MMLWLLTFCGPWGPEDEAVRPKDHAWVLLGYGARVLLFFYCLAHVCQKCNCCCVGCGCKDWELLENQPCTPGRPRLRYLTYYLLTRPRYLLLVNLPLGYPLAFFASFASAARCCFVLILALALRPASRKAIGEHSIERETRQSFDVGLALRLVDFAYEAYEPGPPPPSAVVVRGCGRAPLNSRYLLDLQRTASGASCVYIAAAPVDASATLRRLPQGEWQLLLCGECVAYVRDAATAPDDIRSPWFEVHEDEPRSNADLRVLRAEDCMKRRFERRPADADQQNSDPTQELGTLHLARGTWALCTLHLAVIVTHDA